jgi:hypothetical protein
MNQLNSSNNPEHNCFGKSRMRQGSRSMYSERLSRIQKWCIHLNILAMYLGHQSEEVDKKHMNQLNFSNNPEHNCFGKPRMRQGSRSMYSERLSHIQKQCIQLENIALTYLDHQLEEADKEHMNHPMIFDNDMYFGIHLIQ